MGTDAQEREWNTLRNSRSLGGTRTAARRHALTLVELLAVLGIVSMLAALLLPVFAKARAAGQRTVCLSNIRQAAMGAVLYLQDYDEMFPSLMSDPYSASRPGDTVYWHDHFCRATSLQAGQVTWVSLVGLYASPKPINGAVAARLRADGSPPGSEPLRSQYLCPSDYSRDRRPVTSYEYKLFLAEGRCLSEISSPTDMLIFWEQWAYHVPGMESEYDRRAQLNTAFIDGHAKWLRLSDTTSARYGTGPDLHESFVGQGPSAGLSGRDIVD